MVGYSTKLTQNSSSDAWKMFPITLDMKSLLCMTISNGISGHYLTWSPNFFFEWEVIHYFLQKYFKISIKEHIFLLSKGRAFIQNCSGKGYKIKWVLTRGLHVQEPSLVPWVTMELKIDSYTSLLSPETALRVDSLVMPLMSAFCNTF